MKSRILLLSILFSASTALNAEPLMTKAEYEDYSVQYRCIEIKHVRDLKAKEAALLELEEKYNINEDSFDALDALISKYERDDELLDRIRTRVQKECTE